MLSVIVHNETMDIDLVGQKVKAHHTIFTIYVRLLGLPLNLKFIRLIFGCQ